jgi:Bifunctional DNA primase/polymerase, N-terminal
MPESPRVAGLHGEAAPAPDVEVIVAFVEEFGVPVFPLRPSGKEPAIAKEQGGEGFKDATRDVTQIRRWAAEYRTCNWGMPTGAVTGIFALDIDIKPAEGKRGDETLDRLMTEHGPLPDTVTTLTTTGGMHLWFRLPEGATIKSSSEKHGSGFDVKAEGGYLVIPPSQINGRAYQFEASGDPSEVGIAQAPAWLIELLTAKPEPEKNDREAGTQRAVDWIASIAEGNALHDSLRDLAAHYAAKGLPFGEICRLLESLLNGSKAPRDD